MVMVCVWNIKGKQSICAFFKFHTDLCTRATLRLYDVQAKAISNYGSEHKTVTYPAVPN